TAQAAQQGRFAAAGAAEQGEDLALADRQVGVLDRDEAIEFLAHVDDAQVVLASLAVLRTVQLLRRHAHPQACCRCCAEPEGGAAGLWKPSGKPREDCFFCRSELARMLWILRQ